MPHPSSAVPGRPRRRAVLVAGLCLLVLPSVPSAARAADVPLEFGGDHRVIGEAGNDRRALRGTTAPGATVRTYRVDAADPTASCTGTPLTVADGLPSGNWSTVVDGFAGIVFAQATLGDDVGVCRPAFVPTLPTYGSAGVRTGTAIEFVHLQRRSNPGSSVWPLGDYEYVRTSTTTSQIQTVQSTPTTIDVGGVQVTSPVRLRSDIGNLRFGTSYTKLSSTPGDLLRRTDARRTADEVAGYVSQPFMRVRLFDGVTCDGSRVLATTYADDEGRWVLPVPAGNGVLSTLGDFDGAMPTPPAGDVLAERLDAQIRSSAADRCVSHDPPADPVAPSPLGVPPAPTNLELLPDPTTPGAAIVRGAAPRGTPAPLGDDEKDGRYAAVQAYAARDASCSATGAWLGTSVLARDFATTGVRLADVRSLDVDRVGVRAWSAGGPSPCATAVARSARAVTVARPATPVAVGDRTRIGLRVAVGGPWGSRATTLRVAGAPGVRLEPVAGTSCVADGAGLACAVPAIDAGAAHDVEVAVLGAAAGEHRITATLDRQTRDVVPADDVATTSARVAARAADPADASVPVPGGVAPVAPPAAAGPPFAAPVVADPPTGTLRLLRARGTTGGRVVRVTVRLAGPGTVEAVATRPAPRVAQTRARSALQPGPRRFAYARARVAPAARGTAVLLLRRTPEGRRVGFGPGTRTFRVLVRHVPAGGAPVERSRLVRVRIDR